MTDSENLYQQIKSHFLTRLRQQIVIEISELPISQWRIVSVNNVDEMVRERYRLLAQHQDFAGYIHHENEYYFYFVDSNLYKCEVVDTGRVDDFQDRTFSEFNLNQVATELRILTQGS